MASNVVARAGIRGADELSKGLGHRGTPKSATAEGSIMKHFRTTLSLVLMSLLVMIGGTSLYLQFRQLQECIHADVGLNEEQMNQPSKLTVSTDSAGHLPPNADNEDRTINNNNDDGQLSHRTTRRDVANERTGTEEVNLQPSPSDETKDKNHKLDQQEPILVYTNMGFNREEPCDIPCIYTSYPDRRREADASVYERRGYAPPEEGDRFSIYLQMEGEHYYPISLEGYQLENSYRWSSPLLKPYFEWIHYLGANNISNPPVAFNDTINGASFIARNCGSLNNREDIVTGLRKAGFQVDGLSTCLQTKNPSQSYDKIAMMRPYKFNLAFENGNVQDYVTEKVYQALAAGVVPIYMGAPNIREYVPDHSIINVADFDFNTTLLAEYLKKCMNNQTLYESYHAWRFQPLPEWFLRKFNFTWDTTECRTCRYVHAMKNGWKWDKETQRGIPPTTTTK
jgi:hypothetical protein